MTINEQAAEALEQAAGFVQKGWTQHQLQTPAGRRVCAVGAVTKAIFGNATAYQDVAFESEESTSHIVRNKAIRGLAGVMTEQYPVADLFGSPMFVVATCNDQLVSDKSEIISCMEKAAANLREHV